MPIICPRSAGALHQRTLWQPCGETLRWHDNAPLRPVAAAAYIQSAGAPSVASCAVCLLPRPAYEDSREFLRPACSDSAHPVLQPYDACQGACVYYFPPACLRARVLDIGLGTRRNFNTGNADI